MVWTNALLSILGQLVDGKKVEVRERSWHQGTYTLLFSKGQNSQFLDLRANYLVWRCSS